MQDYKPNSHRFKEEQKESETEKKKIKKVVTGKVKTKKKNELGKLTDIFISEDAKNVKSYVFMDVLVPAIKKAISDIVRDGIDMILYGESGRRKNSGSGGVSYVSYRNYSDRDRRDDRYSSSSYSNRSRCSLDNIVLESIRDAQEVLIQMDDILNEYGEISVADLYDLLGETGDYTDNKYGWKNLSSADYVRVRDGYRLKLPRPVPLK